MNNLAFLAAIVSLGAPMEVAAQRENSRHDIRDAIQCALNDRRVRDDVSRELRKGTLIVPFVEKGTRFLVGTKVARSITWAIGRDGGSCPEVEIYCLIESRPRESWQERRIHLQGVVHSPNVWFTADVGYDGHRWRIEDLQVGIS